MYMPYAYIQEKIELKFAKNYFFCALFRDFDLNYLMDKIVK